IDPAAQVFGVIRDQRIVGVDLDPEIKPAMVADLLDDVSLPAGDEILGPAHPRAARDPREISDAGIERRLANRSVGIDAELEISLSEDRPGDALLEPGEIAENRSL